MFKKTVMAAAIAAVASAPAMAAEWKMNDGDTKFAVNVELSAYYLDEDKGAENETNLSGDGVNQLEFKGSHKVNDMVTVFGEVELDFDPIEDNGAVKTDDTKIGFKHKNFGQLMVGQFDSYYEDKVAEMLDISAGENTGLSEFGTDQDEDHIQYLNSMGDLTFAVDLTYVGQGDDDTTSTSSDDLNDSDWGTALTLSYKLGDLKLVAGMENVNSYDKDGALNTGTDIDQSWGVGASYKMGNADLYLLMANTEAVNGTETDYQGVGIEYGIGATTLQAAIQNVDADGSAKRTEWNIGASYEMFKDMNVYAAMVDKDDAAGEGDAMEVGFTYEF
jgi:predicted porin